MRRPVFWIVTFLIRSSLRGENRLLRFHRWLAERWGLSGDLR